MDDLAPLSPGDLADTARGERTLGAGPVAPAPGVFHPVRFGRPARAR